VLQI